jgi:hypothetical protein
MILAIPDFMAKVNDWSAPGISVSYGALFVLIFQLEAEQGLRYAEI